MARKYISSFVINPKFELTVAIPESLSKAVDLGGGSIQPLAKGKEKKKKIYVPPIGLLSPPIACNKTENEFREFIKNLLINRGNVRNEEVDKYLDEYGMSVFTVAFTHETVNLSNPTENYEILEHLGDTTVDKATSWYLKSRFSSQIAKKGKEMVDILSKQRAILVSKTYMSRYSQRLGISDYIRYRPLRYKDSIKEFSEKTTEKNESMKEDVFEALFGAIEQVIDQKEELVGVGYSVCYNIMRSIYDEEDISVEKKDLVDYRTQLKEIFDKFSNYKQTGQTNIRAYGEEFVTSMTGDTMELVLNFGINYQPKPGDSLVTGPPNLPVNDRSTQFRIRFGPVKLAASGETEVVKKALEQVLAKYAQEYLVRAYGSRFSYSD